jgi:hypothetical protein
MGASLFNIAHITIFRVGEASREEAESQAKALSGWSSG